MQLRRISWEEVDWDLLDSYPDRTVHQTRAWLEFVAATQNAEPVVALLTDGSDELGYFTGLVVRKLGFPVLGSPFPGWTTSYMGFNLKPGVSRAEAARLLPAFAFSDLGCVHLELMDRRISMDTARALNYEVRSFTGFEVDLTRSEDVLFSSMSSACRRCIRKSGKCGVVVEPVGDMEDARRFVSEYYQQLQDVFAKQSLVPTYPFERVEALVEFLFPTGNLLLLRAVDAEGACIATGIFPAFNDTMFFWGGASWRNGQSARPNEAIQWHAIRYWKERGISRYDMSGKGEYKRKYGGEEICVPFMRRSRVSALEPLRNAAKVSFRMRQRVEGLFKK